MSEYTESKIDLVLNHLSKQIYDELEAQGALSSNELYLVDEEYLDGLGVPIVNVGDPISSSDAATKNYVDGIASGFVPLTRTINGKSLSSNIILNASDVSALQSYSEVLSIILVDDGLKISDTAGVYHLILKPNGFEHNFPDTESHFLEFPAKSGTIAIVSDLNEVSRSLSNYLPLSGGIVSNYVSIIGSNDLVPIATVSSINGMGTLTLQNGSGAFYLKIDNLALTSYNPFVSNPIVVSFPLSSGTLAIAANPSTSGHIAILDSNGNAKDGGVFLSNLNMVETTYSDLLQKKTNAEMIPGMQYRITDFVTTVDLIGTEFEGTANSAGHAFDLIVVADSVDKLNESARAIRHLGDSYFPSSTKFEAWKIWYCLDNDKHRFLWADETNGKGVIYRMIDEFNNDVPYDFKNIRFIPWTPDDSWEDGWRYTFDDGEGNDASLLNELMVKNNTIRPCVVYYYDGAEEINYYPFSLNRIVFLGNNCNSNFFGNNCNDNSFGNSFYDNSFGSDCHYNSFGNGCFDNSFGNSCYGNSFGSDCYGNSFRNDCNSNSFGISCYDISFGNDCNSNSFGNNCYGIFFENGCFDNSLGNNCSNISFGNSCYDIVFGNSSESKDFYRFITIGSGNMFIYLECTNILLGEIDEQGNYIYYQNVTIQPGVNNKEDDGGNDLHKTISDSNVGQTFHTTYQPANSQVVSI